MSGRNLSDRTDRRVLVSGGAQGQATGIAVLALPGLTPIATAPGRRGHGRPGRRPRTARARTLVNDIASVDRDLRVLDPDDGRVRAVVDAVPSATRLVPGAGGRWLYVLGADGLSVVDTTGPRIAARRDVGDEDAEDAAVSPDGRALYVAVARTLRIRTTTARGAAKRAVIRGTRVFGHARSARRCAFGRS